MRKKIVFIILLIILNFFVNSQTKTRIVVLNFSVKGEAIKEPYLADALVDNLITYLVETKKYTVLERSELAKIMNELKLQNSDDFNDQLRIKLGEFFGAEVAILGSLSLIGNKYILNVRAVDIKTAEILFAKSLTSDTKEGLIDLVPKIVALISGDKSKDEVIKEIEKEKKVKTYKFNARAFFTAASSICFSIGLITLVPACIMGIIYLDPEGMRKMYLSEPTQKQFELDRLALGQATLVLLIISGASFTLAIVFTVLASSVRSSKQVTLFKIKKKDIDYLSLELNIKTQSTELILRF